MEEKTNAESVVVSTIVQGKLKMVTYHMTRTHRAVGILGLRWQNQYLKGFLSLPRECHQIPMLLILYVGKATT